MSITPGVASSDYINMISIYPLQYQVVTVGGVDGNGHELTDFASLEPVRMAEMAGRPSAQDLADRLRLAVWLLGPSIIAMVTIARRRDIKRNPG